MNGIKIPLVIGIISGLCQVITKEPLAHHQSSTVAIGEAPHLDAGGYGGRFGDLGLIGAALSRTRNTAAYQKVW